ncbi:alpha/beta hydrolase [Streptomyces sp. NPDC048664]|uniref:alpha/beta hydrolase n=1 Tax=Streptomyces sp. NPDC048664 TaxID=3154505 RepID=UPI003418914B
MLSTRTRPVSVTVAGTTAVLALLTAALPATAETGRGPDLSRFYRQRIAWSSCPDEGAPKDLQCGKVTVPLDYARPGGGTLELAMARYRATGRSRGSVLLNFGGPGGAGVPELAAGGKDFMDLTNGYDVVTFDPRGVGRSSPVTCGQESAGSTDATGSPADETDPKAVLGQVRALAEQCAQHSGPVLAHIGTVDAARDLDVMREALGDRKLNYLGFSYGTRLGAVYAARFPGKVGRVVLDGVDTLTEPLSTQGIEGAQAQQTALDDFLTWCVRNMICPFGRDARSAREEVVRLIDTLDRDPVPTTAGPAFSGQDLVGAIGQALFSKQLWPLLEQGLSQLMQQGDPTGIIGAFGSGMSFPFGHLPGDAGPRARSAPSAPPRENGALVAPEDVPLDNLPAALMAINCADDPDRPDAARITRDLGHLREAYTQASPVFGRYRLTEMLMCYGRPKGTDFIRRKVKNVHTPRMLLVGTRGDPATPYRWTMDTAGRLGSSAVVLDNRDEGHTGYSSSRCVHDKVDSFLLDGSLPANGSSCGPDGTDGPD